jgi:TonB-dependent receptor
MANISGRPGLLSAAAIGALLAASPSGAQTPDADQTAQPTDIGRVTATGATPEAYDARVKPSGTGTRTQAKAAEQAAPNKIIVQPLSEIQKLPDVTIAQALSRLPGISMETDSGEGRFINIRGLDSDLNATTFDGVRIMPSNLSTPTGGGRAVAYDVLPAGLVGGIEVTESLRPEDDAEGIGGSVNLLPRTPPADGLLHVSGTAGMGLEFLRDTQIIDYGLTVSGSWGLNNGPFDRNVAPGHGWVSNPKPFSIIITDAQHNDYRGVDDFEPAYSDTPGYPDKLLNGVNLRYYVYNRRRFDRGAEFDFDPNPDNHFFVRYGLGGYNEHANKTFLNLNNMDSGIGTPGGVIYAGDPSGRSFFAPAAFATRSSTDTEEELRNQVLEFGGRNILFDTVKLDYHGAYSVGTDKFPTSYGSFFTSPTFPLAYNNQNDSAHLFYKTLNGTNLLDQSIYTGGVVSNSPSSSRDGEWSGAVNATLPYAVFTPDDTFKAGVIARRRDRVVQNSAGVNANLPGTLANYVSGPDLTYYNGYYTIGPWIQNGAVNHYLGNMQAGYDPTALQHDVEDVYGGYVQYTGAWRALSWLAGVRLESTFGVYEQAPGQANFVRFKDAYTSFFPSVQLKYALGPNMDIRAIYSTGVGRPGFQQITPGASFTASPAGVTVGNPRLSPEYADNFDLFWEKFLANGGKISFGGFDKELNTFIFQSTINAAFGTPAFPPGLVGTIIPPGVVPPGTIVPVTTYLNSGPSRVYGIEAEWTQQFQFLPAPFDGFGVDSNFTYNQSSATIRRLNAQGVEASETLQQPQTSPWNFNASVFYEKNSIEFRLAANYVSKDLYSLGHTKATDVYVQQRFRLDLGTAYHINDHLQIYFDAHNLTDQALKYTETASVSRPIQREFYGIDVIGGVRFNY